MRLSVIMPAHNEEDNIEESIRKIEGVLDIEHELIIINDHSSDSTVRIILNLCRQYPNLRLLNNTKAPGFANAVITGLENFKGEAVVPVMGDLCDELGTIKLMLEKIAQGYDVVCGSRYIKGGARIGGSRLKGFFSSFAGWTLYYLLRIPTHDIANAFKMYRRQVIEKVEINAKSFEISMELSIKAYYLGFKIAEIPTIWRERKKGKSSFKMFKLAPNYAQLYLWAIFKRFIG